MSFTSGERLVGETSTEAILIKFRKLPPFEEYFSSESSSPSDKAIAKRERLNYNGNFNTLEVIKERVAYKQPKVAKLRSVRNIEEILMEAYEDVRVGRLEDQCRFRDVVQKPYLVEDPEVRERYPPPKRSGGTTPLTGIVSALTMSKNVGEILVILPGVYSFGFRTGPGNMEHITFAPILDGINQGLKILFIYQSLGHRFVTRILHLERYFKKANETDTTLDTSIVASNEEPQDDGGLYNDENGDNHGALPDPSLNDLEMNEGTDGHTHLHDDAEAFNARVMEILERVMDEGNETARPLHGLRRKCGQEYGLYGSLFQIDADSNDRASWSRIYMIGIQLEESLASTNWFHT
ncbi:hypothetical protein S40285_10424 [Stachybotrys chlorohalonatus IBT 40285]|uniref:Uncharacterized protein n=1 Tax=Stachybotrys chlorohalonatus (strain IBT 40285) TaxID=1283841 RepID=A0A084QMH7_STAC4|nr:hypothetical protein S40285_10424 [Stachybotrys chlorohalonata IBT 40285]